MDKVLSIFDIVEGIRLKDPGILSILFEKYYPLLTVFAFKYVRIEVVVQDMAIESLAKIFSLPKDLNSIEHFESFLFLIAKNASINYTRRIKTKKNSETGFLTTNIDFDIVDVMNLQLDNALYEKLYQAIESLPKNSRKIIRYLYIDKLSHREISALTNTSVKNIENMRVYALKKLRIYFKI